MGSCRGIELPLALFLQKMSFCLAIIFPVSHCFEQFLFPFNEISAVVRPNLLWDAYPGIKSHESIGECISFKTVKLFYVYSSHIKAGEEAAITFKLTLAPLHHKRTKTVYTNAGKLLAFL